MNRATLTLLALLFILQERAQIEERKLNQEWLRLEYEQRNLSKSARIRDVARNQLRMSPITPERTLYLREAK
jgi:cell division protein FtsL